MLPSPLEEMLEIPPPEDKPVPGDPMPGDQRGGVVRKGWKREDFRDTNVDERYFGSKRGKNVITLKFKRQLTETRFDDLRHGPSRRVTSLNHQKRQRK